MTIVIRPLRAEEMRGARILGEMVTGSAHGVQGVGDFGMDVQSNRNVKMNQVQPALKNGAGGEGGFL
jgi:hypothetical protein